MAAQSRQEPRIAIIGAGPAGLSTAYYLKKRGYTDVMVFEKLGRVGGLCRTITEGYRSYDLGANYIAPGYRETIKIAKEVGSKFCKGRKYIAAKVPEDSTEDIKYYAIEDAIRRDPSNPDELLPWSVLALALSKYLWQRYKVRHVIDQPTFEGVAQHDRDVKDGKDKLAVSFRQWLINHGIYSLGNMFEIPITMMGYGFLNEIAAPYALKFMDLRTMILGLIPNGMPILKDRVKWPKRFELGFERFWETVSWGLNVRLDIDIEEIERIVDQDPENPIRIKFTQPDHVFHETKRRRDTLYFDHVILACPLVTDVLDKFLTLSAEENRLFGKVQEYSYCITTFHCDPEPEMPEPIVCLYPFSDETIGRPWVAVRLWPENSHMHQFYTRVSIGEDENSVRQRVISEVKKLIKQMGGAVAGSKDVHKNRMHTYDRWSYFGHLSTKDFEEGYFNDIGDLQGKQRTYYTGGATNFELVEAILQHSKGLVEKNFPSLNGDTDGQSWMDQAIKKVKSFLP